jgi:putative transferase (TIGR04331 family)
MSSTNTYLVTTHDRGTWPSHASLLCIDSGLSEEPNTGPDIRPTEICPSDERLNRHHQLSDLCSELLVDLSAYLNALHNEDSSIDIWKIRFGLWLHHYVDTVYERWLSISAVEKLHPGIKTEIFATDAESICPRQGFDFYPISQTAQWNHWIAGEIAKFRDEIEVVSANTSHNWDGPANSNADGRSLKPSLRNLMRSALLRMGLMSPHILATTYLPRKSETMLALRLKSVPTIWSDPAISRSRYNSALRNSVPLPKINDTSFNAFIRSIICSQIPRSMVEDYVAFSQRARTGLFARTPRTIFTANLHVTSDLFSLWMSIKKSQGTKIILAQHGGQYGQVAPPTRTEEHEISVASKYFTWGWKTNDLHVVAAPAVALVDTPPSSVGANLRNSLLLITDCTSRYARRPWSIDRDNAHYLNNLFGFVEKLSSDERSALCVRLHHDHAKYDFSHSTRWLNRFPEINLDSGQSPLAPLRATARLIVCTSLGTSELEQLAAGRPTLFLLDPRTHPVRASEQQVFSQLENAQVLFRDGGALASHIQKIWGDVEGWWSLASVREAIDLYKEHFVKQVPDPIFFFRNEILAAVQVSQ